MRQWLPVVLAIGVAAGAAVSPLQAGEPVVEGPAAFEPRCIPPDCVVRRLRMPNMRPPLALSGGRLAALGATRGSTTGSQRRQPGATQGGPTTGDEMMPPFDLRYFLGDWEIEWSPLDTPLLPGGAYTGVERIRHIADGRYLEVTVELEGQDRSLSGRGIAFLETGPFGAHLTKYVVYDAGFALLQPGTVGGDLGGFYSHFWETPAPIEHGGAELLIRGRSYLVSPYAYRVNQEVSVDGGPFVNFGVMWYTKVLEETGQER